MKKYLFFILLITLATQMKAQLPWTIRLGSKIVLQSKGEDEVKNVLSLKNSQVLKNDLILTYRVKPDEKDWERTVMIYDPAGVNIAENPVGNTIKRGMVSRSFTINNKILKELMAKHKKIKIYFTSIPTDPEKAAVVRVKRVHIFTIAVK